MWPWLRLLCYLKRAGAPSIFACQNAKTWRAHKTAKTISTYQKLAQETMDRA